MGLPWRTRGNRLCQDSRSPEQYLNPRLQEYSRSAIHLAATFRNIIRVSFKITKQCCVLFSQGNFNFFRQESPTSWKLLLVGENGNVWTYWPDRRVLTASCSSLFTFYVALDKYCRYIWDQVYTWCPTVLSRVSVWSSGSLTRSLVA
jgi:hypothetical protein